jgi:predicted O-linked N-acetylglucosamine transferase (SPINDLY family)
MATAYDDGKSAADLAAVCAEAVQDLVIAPRFAMSNTDGRPLKIGFVSADLRGHSVSAFVEPLFANADPSEIELLVYANIAKPDAVTERLKSHVSLWRDTNDWDDHETSVAVAADGVDILFDLAGHTGDARLDLFALRPAPVQASWLGWPATTGLAAIDFKLSDALLTPADTTEPFTETPLNLAGPALCFQPPSFAPEVAPLPALANGHITFGSFNRIAKASPRTLALWAEVLTAMPSAQLYLKDNAFRCPVATAHYSDRLTAAGITPDRVTLNPSTTAKDEHLTHYGQVDIALDSVPYNGVTTTCEALWMGVPTVSLVGESSLSRYGLSVLTHAGFESCVATDGKGYVERALKLASNPTELSAIRQGMREHLKTTALLDGPAFAHNFAAGCREMVEIITNQ